MITRNMNFNVAFLFILLVNGICSAAKLARFPEKEPSETGKLPETVDNPPKNLNGRGLFADSDLPYPIIPDDYVIKEPLEPEFGVDSMDDVNYNGINRRESHEDSEDSKSLDEDEDNEEVKTNEEDESIPFLSNGNEIDEEAVDENVRKPEEGNDEKNVNEDDEKNGEKADEGHANESDEENAKEDQENHKEKSNEEPVNGDDEKDADDKKHLDDKDVEDDKEQSEEVGKDLDEENKTDEEAPDIDGDLIHDSPFFNLEQMMKYLDKLERAMDQLFRRTVEDVNLLNGTYVNSTDEEIEIEGHKFKVHKSIMKVGDNNSSIFIEAVQSAPEFNRTKRSNWYSEDAASTSDADP